MKIHWMWVAGLVVVGLVLWHFMGRPMPSMSGGATQAGKAA